MKAFDYNNFQFIFIEGLDEDLEKTLITDFNIEELDVEDIFSSTQLSKIEQRPHYLYVALQFPEFDKSKQIYVSKEVHCLLSTDYFILIDKHNLSHAHQFNNLKENLFPSTILAMDLFYEMVDFMITRDFRIISKLRKEAQDLEEDIFNFENSSDLVREILIYRRNLSTFRSVVYPLSLIVEDLQSRYSQLITQDGIEKLDDSLDKLKKMLNNLDNLISYSRLLSESNEAIIARSTNEIIKTLTSASIIALVPTAIFGFFGMNVYFGFVDNQGFAPVLIITLFSILVTTGVLYYFKKKGWI